MIDINKLGIFFWKIGLILLPFDALPKIMPSNYRPISVYFFFISFIISFFHRKVSHTYIEKKMLDRTNLVLFIFFAYSIFSGIIVTIARKYPLNGIIDFILTAIIGWITYYVNNYYLKFIGRDNVEKIFLKSIIKGYSFAFFIGFIQLLSKVKVIPVSIIANINLLFSGMGRTDRIQMVTAEPSWASMQLLYIIPLIIYTRKAYGENKYNYKYYILLPIILFVVGFSFQGIIAVIVGVFLYTLFSSKHKVKFILKIVVIFIVLGGVGILVIKNINSDAYYILRIKNILQNRLSFTELIYLDGSTFTRIVYPIIGLIIFCANPLLGVGGGNYKYEFSVILTNYFSRGLGYNEVAIEVANMSATNRNLFVRILCESGIVAFIIFMVFIGDIIYKSYKYNANNILKLMFWIYIGVILNFDSYSYVNLWIVMAVLNNSFLFKNVDYKFINSNT